MPGGLDLGRGHVARLCEADKEIHGLGSRLLLDEVLEQEVARIRVRALAVHGGAPPRELRHVLVVLRRPRAELGARQLALHPLLGERVQPAVSGIDGGLELLAERARRGHGRLLFIGSPRTAGARSQTRLACGCGSHCGPAYSKGPHCHSQSTSRKIASRTRRTWSVINRSARRTSRRLSASMIARCSRTSAWTRRGATMAMVQTGWTCSRMCSRTSTSFAFSARWPRAPRAPRRGRGARRATACARTRPSSGPRARGGRARAWRAPRGRASGSPGTAG